MAEVTKVAWSHVGLCVSDLERSVRFYCDGLGCERAERFELDSDQLPGLAEALEVPPPAVLVSQMLTQGPLRIELLGWVSPEPDGAPPDRRTRLGLTHLSFWVDDVTAAADRAVSHGGTLLPSTRQSPGVDLVFVTDPDGTRVELMAQPAAQP